MDAQIKAEEFYTFVSSLIGERISHTWKGYGSAIFLEIGSLVQGKRNNPRGAGCIFLNWDWRVENDAHIIGGSSDSGGKIVELVRQLEGLEISAIDITPPPQELCIFLSNRKRIRSMAATSGDPQWHIRLRDDRWLGAASGAITLGTGASGPPMTGSEIEVSDHEEETASRWGYPANAQKTEKCAICRSYVPLDGNFQLLDFGACTNASSSLDGRITNCRSWCEAFESR